MGNCISNSGPFEPPGAEALESFKVQRAFQNDPLLVTLRTTTAELNELKKFCNDHPRAVPQKPEGPKCLICKNYVDTVANPWKSTRMDLLSLDVSDDSVTESDNRVSHYYPPDRAAKMEQRRTMLKKRGLELRPCSHIFCGACIAQYIYHNLNIPFNLSDYGKQNRPMTECTIATTIHFPMSCPGCPVTPGEKLVEIDDAIAQLILGEGNMEEWHHARFLTSLDIMYCPYKNCGEAFDLNDIAAPLQDGNYMNSVVQCPRCRQSLCKDCKVVWHDKLSCAQFQALSPNERAPEDRLLLELADKEKWRRCPKCRAVVELRYGCNHITCTCKHHFCYTCGADFQYTDGRYHCIGGKGCLLWDEALLLER